MGGGPNARYGIISQVDLKTFEFADGELNYMDCRGQCELGANFTRANS